MSHPFHTYVNQQLEERLQKHSAVVFYDPRLEFAPFRERNGGAPSFSSKSGRKRRFSSLVTPIHRPSSGPTFDQTQVQSNSAAAQARQQRESIRLHPIKDRRNLDSTHPRHPPRPLDPPLRCRLPLPRNSGLPPEVRPRRALISLFVTVVRFCSTLEPRRLPRSINNDCRAPHAVLITHPASLSARGTRPLAAAARLGALLSLPFWKRRSVLVGT
jgi:hypothetical protein